MPNTRTKTIRSRPDLSLERLHAPAPARVCGLDEVGRGPLAGPVVAAAVLLPDVHDPHGGLPADIAARIDDSKKVPAARRAELATAIRAHARVGVALADVAEIDALNILHASMLAMCRAVEGLGVAPDLALVDGNRAPPGLACRCVTVVKGDARSLSIAAASIVAKVERDRIMAELAQNHPDYGWDRNAGYPTAEHLRALRERGPTPHHRRSFAPVEQWPLTL
ncbi:MAG TPA: ribonuclease HII [Azospirillaceae bacterium]|nr:ribonuclease HII [Azospirillaceae bacterium]